MSAVFYYKLQGHKAVPCKDVLEWSRWYEKADRHVAETFVGKTRISTIFLGLNHSFHEDDDHPLLFESMIYGGPADQEQLRYCFWEDAEAGHQLLVEYARTCQRSPKAWAAYGWTKLKMWLQRLKWKIKEQL
jgi:hypothetical protein